MRPSLLLASPMSAAASAATNSGHREQILISCYYLLELFSAMDKFAFMHLIDIKYLSSFFVFYGMTVPGKSLTSGEAGTTKDDGADAENSVQAIGPLPLFGSAWDEQVKKIAKLAIIETIETNIFDIQKFIDEGGDSIHVKEYKESILGLINDAVDLIGDSLTKVGFISFF